MDKQTAIIIFTDTRDKAGEYHAQFAQLFDGLIVEKATRYHEVHALLETYRDHHVVLVFFDEEIEDHCGCYSAGLALKVNEHSSLNVLAIGGHNWGCTWPEHKKLHPEKIHFVEDTEASIHKVKEIFSNL